MNNYVNAFQIFSSNDHDEVILQLFQKFPISDLDEESSTTVGNELVASLVMNKQIALQLAENITDMIQKK